jgi:SAM-dependent methyltransferase
MIKNLLLHPLARGLDVDDPATTEVRRRIIRSKPFLRRLYDEWYKSIVAGLPGVDGPVVELGSGAGHLEEFLPGVVKSEILTCPHVAVVLDAGFLPFADASLRALTMTDVFHHLPKPEAFLREAVRCLRPGGSVVMIEPWVTSWSRFVYRRLHPEPFDPDAQSWEFPSSGPLSGANSALPWIVFNRDRGRFHTEFPLLRIESVEPMMPVRYLLSGGVSLRSLQPGWTFPLWRSLERALKPYWPAMAMFARIVIRRIDGENTRGGKG